MAVSRPTGPAPTMRKSVRPDSSPARDAFTARPPVPGLLALERPQVPDVAGLREAVEHLHVHVGVVLVVLLGHVRVAAPALQAADAVLDAPALRRANHLVVVPAGAGPGGPA